LNGDARSLNEDARLSEEYLYNLRGQIASIVEF
jgi:hypothetical protein